MRRKAILIGLVAAMTIVVAAITALPTSAKPDFGGVCGSCHTADATVSASVTETGSGGGTTTYSFSISGPYAGQIGFGVFNSAGAKVASGTQSSGSFSVANGDTYTFYGVNKDKASMSGFASRSLAPSASVTPTPTATTPPTTSIITPTETVTPTQPVTKSREIEGIIQTIDGSVWTVNGITVTVPVAITGSAPTVGAKVELRVVLDFNGQLVALKVEVQSADEDQTVGTKHKEDEDTTPRTKDATKIRADDREDENDDDGQAMRNASNTSASAIMLKLERSGDRAEHGDKVQRGRGGQALARNDKGKSEQRDGHGIQGGAGEEGRGSGKK